MATPSIFNRGYSGGIAARGPVPVGRGAYDLNRAAEQTFRRTGNPAALMSMDFRNRLDERRMMPMMPPSLPPTMQAGMPASPSAPAEPKGNWVPGFGGSQIFVKDQPAAPAPAPMIPAMPEPPALNPPAARAQPQGMQAMPQPAAASFPFPPLPMSSANALPPSTLGGGVGLPPAPRVTRMDIPGPDGRPLGWAAFDTETGRSVGLTGNYQQPAPPPFVPTPEQVRQFRLQPDFATGQNYQGTFVPGWKQTPEPTEQVRINPDGTQTITRKQPVGTTPAPASATPATPAGTSGEAPGGWKWQVKPTADAMQTGQMPAANFANDLTPEQSLEAARQHYLTTGDGSKIDEHFKNFPSPAVQALNKESKIWQSLGSVVDRETATQQQIMNARAERDNFIKQAVASNLTAGVSDQLWALQNPKQAALLNNKSWMETANEKNSLYEQARRANAQFLAARDGQPIPADFEQDPGRLPVVTQPQSVAVDRPWWATAQMGAQAMGQDAMAAAQRFAEYARRNPLVTIPLPR